MNLIRYYLKYHGPIAKLAGLIPQEIHEDQICLTKVTEIEMSKDEKEEKEIERKEFKDKEPERKEKSEEEKGGKAIEGVKESKEVKIHEEKEFLC